jgi:hypothetical protein
MVNSTVIDPGLTYDEAVALFGWTIWLGAMTGGAFAVGFYPGARVHSYPSPIPSSIPDPTGSLQRAPFRRENRLSSGVTTPGSESTRLAAVGPHPSCPGHHRRSGSPSRHRGGICRRASPRRPSRDGLAPPRDHPRACQCHALREPDPSTAAFRRALEFLRDVFGDRLHNGLPEEVDE